MSTADMFKSKKTMYFVKRICKNMSCALSAFPSTSSKYEYVAQCASSTLSVKDKLKYVHRSKKRYVKSMFRAKRKNIYNNIIVKL